jgi:hypothetical protein
MEPVKVSNPELPTTNDAMVPVEVSNREPTSVEALTASMALANLSDSESPPTGDSAAAGPSTTNAGPASQPRSFQTLFQTLPPELREMVYFNLGYPVSFYVAHDCNEECLTYFNHQLIMVRANLTHTYDRSGVPASWAEYKSTTKIIEIEASGFKFAGQKVYITGNDVNDDGSPVSFIPPNF